VEGTCDGNSSQIHKSHGGSSCASSEIWKVRIRNSIYSFFALVGKVAGILFQLPDSEHLESGLFGPIQNL